MKYFKLTEFDSPDEPGSGSKMNEHLVMALDIIRDEYGYPMIVNSGYRTKAHNEKVGGVPHSQHLAGKAVDIHIDNQKQGDALEALARKHIVGGIGRYNTFIHIDNRGYEVYWQSEGYKKWKKDEDDRVRFKGVQ